MDLLTTGQAGKRLGIGGDSVRRAIVEGRLPARRIGTFYAIRTEDVEQYARRYPLRPGRPAGSKDRYPRTRRTRFEMEAERDEAAAGAA